MRAYVVSGPAGAGKTTLGRELARATRATLLDLDTATNPMLDAVFDRAGLPGHWNDQQHRSWVRPARYAALRALATDQVALGNDVVLVAPFTAELTGGSEWTQLTGALGPARVLVVWLDLPAPVRAERMHRRGEARDSVRTDPEPEPPRVPHLWIDGTRSPTEQVADVLASEDEAFTR